MSSCFTLRFICIRVIDGNYRYILNFLSTLNIFLGENKNGRMETSYFVNVKKSKFVTIFANLNKIVRY